MTERPNKWAKQRMTINLAKCEKEILDKYCEENKVALTATIRKLIWCLPDNNFEADLTQQVQPIIRQNF